MNIMARPAERIGDKWDTGYRNAVEDAVNGYEGQLPGLPDKIIASKATAKANFTAALDDPSYDQNVRSGLSPGVADVNYGQRLAQIETQGFAQFQKDKMVDETVTRRHLAQILDSVVALATGASGKLELPNVSDFTKRYLVNSALMKVIRNFTPTTTPIQAEAVLIANVAKFPDITIGG